MQKTLLKIVKILAYQQTISEGDRRELIEIAGEDGLFLGQKQIPVVDDTPDKSYVIPHSGIRACAWDGKEFYFYTETQSEVENVMIFMGYDSHGYCLSIFENREEPMTPEGFKWPTGGESEEG